MLWPVVKQERPQHEETAERERVIQPTFAVHVHVLCMVFGVTPDSDRFRQSSRAMNAQGTVCPAMIAEARAFPRNQCTPVCAFLSRRSDRRPLFPSQSSLSLTTNTSNLFPRLTKPSYALCQTSLPPTSTKRTLHIHASLSPPAKHTHSRPAPTKQPLSNRQHGQGKQAFTLVHAIALAAAVATAQAH
jgi:hypothetical protein